MSQFFLFLQSIGASASWDVIFLVLVLVGTVMYGVSVGRDRAVMVLLSMYLALAVVTNAPVLATLSYALRVHQHPVLRLVWFLALFFLIFLVLWRSHVLRHMARERGAWWESVLFGFLQSGLAVSVALFLLPPELMTGLSPFMHEVFLSNVGRSFWLMAPIVGLVFIGRGDPYPDEE